MSQGFIQIPRSLLEHPTILSLNDLHYRIFIHFLLRMTFSKCQQDDHGIIIDLMPGEYMFTLRKLASELGVDKGVLERLLVRLRDAKISRHETRHTKTVLTFTHSDLCELLRKYNETTFETKTRQDQDKIKTEKDKEDNADKENKRKKVKKEKFFIREWVSLSKEESEKLFHLHGDKLANEMLDILDAYNTSRQEGYKSDYGALKTGGWVHREALKRKDAPKPRNAFFVDRRTQNIDGTPVTSPHDGRF